MKKELFDWQKNCIDLWFQNRCRGIVNVATGGGKTILALHAIDLLEKVSPLMEYKQLKVKIVVPKLFLLFQWSNALQNELHVDPKDIGYCYGGSTQITDRKYMIYVVNSARYTLARQIISDFKQNNAVFFIGDECHHYGSEENGKIFDFINYVQENSVHYFSMGLSATPNCKNYTTKLVPALGKEIYRYSIGDAKEILSDFSVITIGVTLTEEEQAAYENFTERLKILTSQLRKNCPWLYKGQDEFFFAQLQTLAKNKKNKKSSELAEQFLFLTYKRKSILYLAEERVHGAKLLIKSLPVTSRIILFSERIETIDELYQCLKKELRGQVGLYHSKMENNLKRRTLQQYESGEIRILLSCKALDEGLNVPETDVGIILSGTGNERQRIQRLGRILRKQEKDQTVYLYFFYTKDTSETMEFFSRKQEEKISHNLDFISNKNCFYNQQYHGKAALVQNNLLAAKVEKSLRTQVQLQITLGQFQSDWLLGEEECQRRLKAATSKNERNYYITMLLLIRASI